MTFSDIVFHDRYLWEHITRLAFEIWIYNLTTEDAQRIAQDHGDPYQCILDTAERVGCVYPQELLHFIASLKQGLKKGRFDPHMWEYTMIVQDFYNIKFI